MKKIVLLMAAVLCALPLFAQVNIGADYYYLGALDRAEHYLRKHIGSDPVKANFYLGEVAFAQGDPAKALEYYNKALAIDPTFMQAQVGLAKLKLKSNRSEAEAIFKELTKANRRSAPLSVAIGRAFLDNGMLKEARQRAEEAIGFDKQYPGGHLLEGDILVAEKSAVGTIAGAYEQAKHFAPKEPLAYMKLAQIYERPSPATAIDNLQKAIANAPGYIPAYSLLGRIYTSLGRYPEVIDALKAYFTEGNYTTSDIERMARAYYFGESDKLGMTEAAKYAEADKWVAEGLQEDPNHFILNRYRMYLSAKTGDPAGIANAEHFFGLRSPADTTYLPLDYTMFGTILKDAGRISEAMAQYDKAIALDPDQLDTYESAIAIARETGDYGQAAKYYEALIETKKRTDDEKYQSDRLLDINALGNLYYQAGTLVTPARSPELVERLMADAAWREKLLAFDASLNADSLRMSQEYFAAGFAKYNLTRAESLFKELIEQAPESYTGYYYLARTSNALYPGAEGLESGVAKELYAKTVSIIENRENGQEPSGLMLRALREGLGYLAYYFYMTDDTENAVRFSTRLLEIDPQNANAKAILEDISGRK